jgi:hypothetical protein
VCKKEHGKAKRKGNVKPNISYHTSLKHVYNIAFRTVYCSQTKTHSMAMEEALPLGMGTREPGCEQARKDDRGGFIPALSWDWPIMLGLAKSCNAEQKEVEAERVGQPCSISSDAIALHYITEGSTGITEERTGMILLSGAIQMVL